MDWIPTASKAVNTAVLLLLVFGLLRRHHPKIHIPVMLSAFAVDLANVLVIEVYARTRGKGAVEQGIESFSGDGHFLEQLHISVSVLCILGYVVAIVSGTRLYRRGLSRRLHKANAAVFGVTRLASYVTSFWMGE